MTGATRWRNNLSVLCLSDNGMPEAFLSDSVIVVCILTTLSGLYYFPLTL